jgi:hypothetical protein
MINTRIIMRLWLAIVLLAFLEWKAVHDTDIFWQIKLGQIMIAERALPSVDRFTYTHYGEPAPAIGWLAQVGFALLYNVGGWPLVRLIHHVALVGALIVATIPCRRLAVSTSSALVAAVIAFLVLLSNADLRPQGLGLLCFSAVLAIAHSALSPASKIVTALPILIAWQNIHPSVAVGALALAGLTAADACDRHRGEANARASALLAVLAAVAQLATPLGAGVFDVAAINVYISRDLMGLAEWLPPWDSRVLRFVMAYWMALAGSLLAFACLGNRVSARDRWLFLVMTILSLYAARFIIFWSVALVPFWAVAIERVRSLGLFAPAPEQEPRFLPWKPAIFAPALAVALLLAAHPARFRPIVDAEIPLSGVAALRAALPGPARIFNDYIWAGPLLLDGSPGWRVSVDGRLYFFRSAEEWRSIEDASAGRLSLEAIERTHNPDAFFLFPPRNRPLIALLSRSRRWRQCHDAPTCAAFVRAR